MVFDSTNIILRTAINLLFYLYIYPLDSQESNGSANT